MNNRRIPSKWYSHIDITVPPNLPTFDPASTSYTIRERIDSVSDIRCYVDCNPRCNITWLKDGQSLNISGNVLALTTPDRLVLELYFDHPVTWLGFKQNYRWPTVTYIIVDPMAFIYFSEQVTGWLSGINLATWPSIPSFIFYDNHTIISPGCVVSRSGLNLKCPATFVNPQSSVSQ